MEGFQEYPKDVHLEDGSTITVNNAEEEKAAEKTADPAPEKKK